MNASTIVRPRRGRPPVPDALRRSVQVSTTVTAAEADEIHAYVAARGITVSDLVRDLTLALVRHTPDYAPAS